MAYTKKNIKKTGKAGTSKELDENGEEIVVVREKMDSKSMFKNIVSQLGNEYATILSEGSSPADITEYIDTGSYVFNLAVSGDMFKGQPNNLVTCIESDPSCGKTFLNLGILKRFLDKDSENRIVIFDSEAAISSKMLLERGFDLERVLYISVNTAEEFGTNIMKIITYQLELPKKERMKLMFCLDSLGMLTSAKLKEDMTEGKDVADMTRAKKLKGVFNNITVNLGRLGIPMLVANHVYAVIGAFIPTKTGAGGSGPGFSSSTIISLTKAQSKDSDGSKNGAIVTATVKKGRLTREGSKVKMRILFDKGMDRYYGLLELAEESGMIKKVGNKFEFPDGTTAFENRVISNPEIFFTEEFLKELNKRVGPDFLYGVLSALEETKDVENDEEHVEENVDA